MSDGRQYSGLFRVATYIPAASVTKLLSTPESVAAAIRGMKAMQVEHVFLEVYRGGHAPTEAVLAAARDRIRQAGIDVGGGLTPTWGEGFGAPTVPQPQEQGLLFCYSHPKTAQDMSRLCGLAGRLFDELILDDFFFTNCECDACRAFKGDRPWWQARNQLLREFAAKAVIAPAHAAKAGCTVIIKYPQWYDRFHQFGYDAAGQTAQFDAIWVGTETRDPHKDDFFGPVQQGQSWSVYRYLCDLGRERTLGGWFDPYGCDEPSFIEQAYQTVLVGTPEMLLFNYDSLTQPQHAPLMPPLMANMPRLRQWAAALKDAQPAGLACYKPPSSFPRSEYYVFDYLTMIGLPITMHASFPRGRAVVFLSGHALADGDVLAKLKAQLAGGGSVVATAEFVAALPAAQMQSIFGLKPRPGQQEGLAQTRSLYPCGITAVPPVQVRLEKPIEVNGLLEAAGAEVLIAWSPHRDLAPYLTRKRHGQAVAIMLDTVTEALPPRYGVNMSRWIPLMDVPQVALDRIRQVLLEPLGLEVRCPGRVGVYCFAGGPVAVCNYRNEPAVVELRAGQGSPRAASLRECPAADLRPEPGMEGLVRQPEAGLMRLEIPARGRLLLVREKRTL